MLRTVYTPDSNSVSFPIPDEYIGTELEIIIFPIREVFKSKINNKMLDSNASFGAWADMDKTTEEICAEIRSSRNFRNRDFL